MSPPGATWKSRVPAFVLQGLNAAEREGFVAAVNRSRQQIRGSTRAAGSPQRPRAAAPPRDAREVKCANCGAAGHTAQACKKPKVPIEECKCHTCGKPGHVAAKCPDRYKAKIAEADHSHPRVDRVLAVTNEDGFIPSQRRRPVPRALTLGEIPAIPKTTQAER